MSSSKSECRKFSPNIFNRSKCQHCFASKDSHSAEALDNNRVTRKVSKCGYLFVAPDWDFSNPLNRTKRWQRRWFVLYDDGELTYSVDEHPDTVPQAIIDMTKVLEVTNAEDVTGNKFAIALTAPEKVHFIKGTSREESQWWFHELAVFPRSIKNSRYKRNATFPGGKASVTKPLESLIRPEESLHSQSESQLSRRRFLSCDTHESYKEKDIILMQTPVRKKKEIKTENPDIEIISSRINNVKGDAVSDISLSTKENESLNAESSLPVSSVNDKVRTRHLLKRERRSPLNPRSHSDTVSYMIQKSFEIGTKHLKSFHKNNSQTKSNEQHSTSKNSENNNDAPKKSSIRQQYHNDKNLEITRKLTGNNAVTDANKCITQNVMKPNLDNNQNYYIPNSNFFASEGKESKSLSPNHFESQISSENIDPGYSISPEIPTSLTDEVVHPEQVRGDPDGMSSFYNYPSNEQDISHSQDYLQCNKKGWLMLQTSNKDWTKYWFVLKLNTLTYYQDPLAEGKNVLEGLFNFNKINYIEEIEAPRHYGFCITLKDNQKICLSALTNNIRASWIEAFRKISDQKDWVKESTLSLGEKIEKEIFIKDSADEPVLQDEHKQIVIDTNSSPRSDLSSDDEFKTASETSGRMEDYFEWADEDADHNSSSRALPPSPPLNRTPISRVKERARTRSNTRVTSEKRERKRLSSGESHMINNKDDFVKDDQSGSDREISGLVDARKRNKQKKQSEKRKPVTNNVDGIKQHESDGVRNLGMKSSSLIDLKLNISNLENQVADLSKQLKSKDYELSVKDEQIMELERLLLREDILQQQEFDEKNLEKSVSKSISSVHNYEKLSNNLEQRLASSETKILDLLSEMDFIYQSHQQYIDSLTVELQKIKYENKELRKKLEQANSQFSEKINNISVNKEKDDLIKQYEDEIVTLKSILNCETNGELSTVIEQFKKMNDRNQLLAVNSNNKSTVKSDTSDSGDMFSSSHKSTNTIETNMLHDVADLQKKLDRTMNEIRFLKQELKQSHQCNDDLELQNIKLKRDLKNLDEDYASQISLMTVRVEDLTSKLSNSEKNNRQLKQKMMRQDNKEQRRTRSLKGKESFNISKEMETKLEELERKLCNIEKSLKICDQKEICTKATKSSSEISIDVNEISGTKSLVVISDSSSSASIAEPLKLLVRMNSLETKVQGAIEKLQDLKSSSNNNDEIALCLNDISFGTKDSGLEDKFTDEVQQENQKSVNTSLSVSSLLTKCTEIAEEYLSCCSCGQNQGWELILNKLKEIKKHIENDVSMPYKCNYQTIQHIVLKLKNLLQKKITYWEEKRTSLKNYGLTNPKIILELWIERILSETFLMGKISCLIQQLHERNNLIQLKDARNCYFKMLYLQKKLQRLKSSASDLNSSDSTQTDPQNDTCDSGTPSFQNVKEIFSQLTQHEQILKKLFQPYRTDSIKTLGIDLAFKTLLRSQSMEDNENQGNVNKELATESCKSGSSDILSQKLVEAEMHRIISNFSKLFENKIFLELEMMLYPLEDHSLKKDQHFKIVKKQLVQDMNSVLQDLQDSYRSALNRIQEERKCDSTVTTDVTTRLAEFICTIAQNSIVVGHCNYLKENIKNVSKDDDQSDDKFLNALYESFDTESQIMNVNIDEYLNQNDALSNELKYVLPYLNEKFPLRDISLNRYVSVQDILQRTFDGKPSYFMNSYEARLQRSFRQRGQRSVTMPICTADSNTTLTENKICGNCQNLQEEIKSLKNKHAQLLEKTKEEYEHRVASLELKYKDDISAMEKNYRDSIKLLQDQICKMEKKQIGKQEEYDQEITALKETYEQEIVQKIDTKINEEVIRQRYQAEIEQLRGLCEKGLIAMENSHRRIIAELEEKHCKELEVLQVEKEQALAEETQATLAALDAMRKAHEVELQREIAKFKQEFLQKMQSTHEMDIIHKEHDGEMENIKQEILSLSEKYSIKCLENATLEERLEPLSRQLADANTLIFDLTARNKQLRAMLEMSSTGLQAILDAEYSTGDLDELKALKVQLKLKENELLNGKEMIAELQQKLYTTKKNEQALDNQCRLLDQSLKAERQLREDEVSSLRDRLEHIILTSNSPAKGTNNSSMYNHEDKSLLQIPSYESKKANSSIRNELSRSPSCPGLNDRTSFPSPSSNVQTPNGGFIPDMR